MSGQWSENCIFVHVFSNSLFAVLILTSKPWENLHLWGCDTVFDPGWKMVAAFIYLSQFFIYISILRLLVSADKCAALADWHRSCSIPCVSAKKLPTALSMRLKIIIVWHFTSYSISIIFSHLILFSQILVDKVCEFQSIFSLLKHSQSVIVLVMLHNG